jgi:hypothetical protein
VAWRPRHEQRDDVDEVGSKEARGRRGGGRDGGRADPRLHGRWAPSQEASGGGERSADTNEEVHTGEERGGCRRRTRRPEVADKEGERVGGSSGRLGAVRRRAAVEDEGGRRRRMSEGVERGGRRRQSGWAKKEGGGREGRKG